jgi:acyl dehydratase
MGSPGLDGVRWLAPVRAGDTLNVRYQTTRVKPSNSKPDRGVVWSKWVAINQHGEKSARSKAWACSAAARA